MKKEDLQKQIADLAYNIGFGAKKNFASYDIAEKLPGIITFITMAVGLFGLILDYLSTKQVSVCLLLFGIINLYLRHYSDCKDQFKEEGERLTRIFGKSKDLCLEVETLTEDTLDEKLKKFNDLSDEYYKNCLTNQILFSGWFAHYKFFWEADIEWLNKYKHFTLWRDKIPLSFTLLIIFLLAICVCLQFP